MGAHLWVQTRALERELFPSGPDCPTCSSGTHSGLECLDLWAPIGEADRMADLGS